MLLRKYCGMEKTENGYLIQGNAGDIKLVFMTDDIIRIRVSFDRKFKEASYALVTTAWEDELDGVFKRSGHGSRRKMFPVRRQRMNLFSVQKL